MSLKGTCRSFTAAPTLCSPIFNLYEYLIACPRNEGGRLSGSVSSYTSEEENECNYVCMNVYIDQKKNLQSVIVSPESFKSHTRIFGLEEYITEPRSPRLGVSEVQLLLTVVGKLLVFTFFPII